MACGQPPDPTRLFVNCLPGLAPLVSNEVGALAGVTVGAAGFDGRSDLVLVEAGRGHREAVLSMRTVEDVFVEVGRAERSAGDDPRSISDRLWLPDDVQRALSIWADEVHHWRRR
ncbi:MAG: hypothetical protein ACRD0A_19690 [Acidimicrobiales bacterium]